MWQDHNDRERFADWPQRLSQREIGQVAGIHEREPWLHFCDQLFVGRYSRGVGKQQALARSKNRTNLERRFWCCLQDRLVWIHRRPVSSSCFALERRWLVQAPQRLYWISPPLLSWTASVFIFSAILQEVGTFHFAFDTNAFTLSSTGDVALVSPAIFNVLAQTRKNRSRTSCFLTSVSRVMFPAALSSSLMKESWRLPTGAR